MGDPGGLFRLTTHLIGIIFYLSQEIHMEDTDIDFMDFESAREYVLAFITTLKKTQKQRAVAEEELEHWRGRVKLADSRGEPVLKRGAVQRVAELEAQTQRLHQEELELRRKVDVLKEKLKTTKIRSSLQVDADSLLAQMQMLVGEPDRLSEELQRTEANQALEALKKKMEKGEDG
jgi:phage shock protein A